MVDKYPLLRYSAKIKQVGNEVYLVNKNEAWDINDSSYFILKKCDGKNSIQDIANQLSIKYNIAESKALSDCNEILNYFLAQELLDI
ncbi:PqqD family protein [Shouchella miscanthi]|uniref:PqqD family protein n=1 Tax=Shouchella miscanthi TaxID=2598861 RepID=A0ABU6NN83_9BACI|nr:PqqD family protein [Shouchella miscanthi]